MPGTFSITKATATVTAGSGTKVYGTSDPTLTATATGFTAADAATITLSATRAAGNSVGRLRDDGDRDRCGAGNYSVSYVPGTFSITKATATVTAGSGTKVYGTADPALTATATGFTAADARDDHAQGDRAAG